MTTPPAGIVAEPLSTVVPTPDSVLVVAPPLTVLLIDTMFPNWDGKTSIKLAVVAVLGPLLLTTSVNVLAPPTEIVELV